MKKIHLIYAAFIIGNAIFWSGCSKNDNDSPNPNPKQEITMPKEAFQLQIVEAQFSQPLLQEEYDADLGGIPLKLVRSDDNTLVFYVPGTTAVGETTLNIPQLEAQAKFEVKKSVLNGNEEVVLKPFFEDLNFSQNRISDEEYSEYLADALTAFEAYYKSLSKDDKNHMALFYQVNEHWFKEILGLNSTSKFTTLGTASTLVKTKKLLASVIIFAGSGYILSLPGTPLEKSLVAVAGVTAGVLAWEYATELVNEINIVERVTDQILGNNLIKSNFDTQGLVFRNEEGQNVNLYTGNRSVTTADELSTAEGTSIYFDAYGRLINITEKVNDVIQFINDNLFFSNISQIPVHKIPDSAEMQSGVLTAEDYNSLKFTVADANVQLSDVSFENGTVRMKMTVKNPDTVTGNSLKTTLNYTYQNEFSNATGSMPIEVKLDKEDDDNYNLFTDAAAVKAILAANGIDVSDPRWNSTDVDVIKEILQENKTYTSDGRVYQLTLTNKNLTVLPSEIGNLTNLIFLHLDDNRLTSIPKEIGNLTNLIGLYLSKNELTSIPTEIGNLTNLSSLSLSFNQLTSIPTEIGNLTNLTYLALNSNQLTSIPTEIGNLTNLTYLALNSNQLISIPASIGNLINLTELDLHSNQLSCLPQAVWDLKYSGIDFSSDWLYDDNDNPIVCN
jgi:Leucine-rich repeat (LRR) protein